MKNKQLTAADRKAIEVLLNTNNTKKDIAKIVQKDYTTICREIKRNGSPNGYIAKYAQARHEHRRKRCRKRRKLDNTQTRNYVYSKLMQGWSPEQISGRMKYEGREDCVCHETIYSFIYNNKVAVEEQWREYLRYGRKKRRKQSGRSVHRSKIPNRTSIRERPKVVERREEYGHWEADSVIYPNKYAIHTMNELKTGFVAFRKLERKTAGLTGMAMVNIIEEYTARTVTVDNGSEFSLHEEVTKATGVQVFFCDPYSSWQRGSNENSNMLLRGYLPKRADISKLNQWELDEIACELNNRPRKRLGWRTPAEVYLGEVYLSKLSKEKVALESRI